jgi:hypothetical protein
LRERAVDSFQHHHHRRHQHHHHHHSTWSLARRASTANMVSFGFVKGWVSDDFKSRNFSIYGQWIGILGMILCFATGISNLFTIKVLPWAIVAIIVGVVILFMEVKWLFKCFKTPETFENVVRKINGNYQRFGAYLIASAPMFASAAFKASSLIATGIILLFAALCFLAAGVMNQDYTGSKTLGGGGMSGMVV